MQGSGRYNGGIESNTALDFENGRHEGSVARRPAIVIGRVVGADDTASRSGLGSILWVFAAWREAQTNVEDVCFAPRPLCSRRRDAEDVWDGRRIGDRHSGECRYGIARQCAQLRRGKRSAAATMDRGALCAGFTMRTRVTLM